MPRATTLKANFTAGELSPRLAGRTDLQKYQNGVSELDNFSVYPHGGISRRGGSQYIAGTRDSSKRSRLYKFEYSNIQTYFLEFGDKYIRIYSHDGYGNWGVVKAAGVPLDIVTNVNYLEADIAGLKFAQTADELYIVHPKYPPATLVRFGHTSWVFADLPFKWNYQESSPWSGTPGDPAANYPAALCFYEQRLWLAGAPENPQGLWASRTGAGRYTDMRTYYNNVSADPNREGDGASLIFPDGTVNDDDAMNYTIATDKVNKILWLSPGKVLIAGTVGGEFTITSTNLDAAITPTNIRIVRQSTYGSSDIQPTRVSNLVLFLQRSARKLRQFVYQFDSDSYVAPDLTILSEHISITGFTEMAYQQEPDSIVWLIKADGSLVGLTYQKDQDVIAWHPHHLAGSSDSSGTPAVIESIASVSGAYPTEYRDEVWVIVRRLINGISHRYVERLSEGLSATSFSVEEGFFVDCGVVSKPRWWQTAPNNLYLTPAPITSIFVIDSGHFLIEGIAHELDKAAVGDVTVKFRNIRGAEELNHRSFIITIIDVDHFSVSLIDLPAPFNDTASFGVYIGGGDFRVSSDVVSGLDHLEGETVEVLADGSRESPLPVVTGGQVSLSAPASITSVGLPYTSSCKTMRLDAGSADGSAQGKIGRITKIACRLLRSCFLEVGAVPDNLEDIPWRTQSSIQDFPPELYTGDKDILFRKGYTQNQQVYLQQSRPFPCNILAVITTSRTND